MWTPNSAMRWNANQRKLASWPDLLLTSSPSNVMVTNKLLLHKCATRWKSVWSIPNGIWRLSGSSSIWTCCLFKNVLQTSPGGIISVNGAHKSLTRFAFSFWAQSCPGAFWARQSPHRLGMRYQMNNAAAAQWLECKTKWLSRRKTVRRRAETFEMRNIVEIVQLLGGFVCNSAPQNQDWTPARVSTAYYFKLRENTSNTLTVLQEDGFNDVHTKKCRAAKKCVHAKVNLYKHYLIKKKQKTNITVIVGEFGQHLFKPAGPVWMRCIRSCTSFSSSSWTWIRSSPGTDASASPVW